MSSEWLVSMGRSEGLVYWLALMFWYWQHFCPSLVIKVEPKTAMNIIFIFSILICRYCWLYCDSGNCALIVVCRGVSVISVACSYWTHRLEIENCGLLSLYCSYIEEILVLQFINFHQMITWHLPWYIDLNTLQCTVTYSQIMQMPATFSDSQSVLFQQLAVEENKLTTNQLLDRHCPLATLFLFISQFGSTSWFISDHQPAAWICFSDFFLNCFYFLCPSLKVPFNFPPFILINPFMFTWFFLSIKVPLNFRKNLVDWSPHQKDQKR